MARSLRNSWNRKDIPGNDKQARDNAEKAVRERDARRERELHTTQGYELKALDRERTALMKDQARDVKPDHERELNAINARHDRRVSEQRRRNNSLLGRVSRVFGGHKRQQARMQRIERERSRDVDNRKAIQERNERLRQKSLAERMTRVERELHLTKERHAVARDEFRQNRERGFEQAVRMEMNRQRKQGRGRSL
jgi:hypothetical protein